MFLVVFHRVHTVKRERREQVGAGNGFAHQGHFRCVFFAQQVTAQPWFCSLSILELNHPGTLYCLFPYAKQSCRHLSDDMICIRNELARIAAFTGAGERSDPFGCHGPAQHDVQGDGPVGHSAAVDREGDTQLRTSAAPVERNRQIYRSFGRRSSRYRGRQMHPVKPAP